MNSFTAKIQTFATEQNLSPSSPTIAGDSVLMAPACDAAIAPSQNASVDSSVRQAPAGKLPNIAHRRQRTSPTPLEILNPKLDSLTPLRPQLEFVDPQLTPLSSRTAKVSRS